MRGLLARMDTTVSSRWNKLRHSVGRVHHQYCKLVLFRRDPLFSEQILTCLQDGCHHGAARAEIVLVMRYPSVLEYMLMC
ncbi:hypothetical protein Mapa_000601 [Marchantia paleacea]|nr:hypothetical protein Mapa_000601 [Marchantia paleacea]